MLCSEKAVATVKRVPVEDRVPSFTDRYPSIAEYWIDANVCSRWSLHPVSKAECIKAPSPNNLHLSIALTPAPPFILPTIHPTQNAQLTHGRTRAALCPLRHSSSSTLIPNRCRQHCWRRPLETRSVRRYLDTAEDSYVFPALSTIAW